LAESRKEGILRRHKRIRKTVTGKPERLRLSVFRSLNHIYAQIVDELKGHTVEVAVDFDMIIDIDLGVFPGGKFIWTFW